MGREGFGPIRNDNGERLIDFCTRHNLFIGGTRFIHKDIHKYTWKSPDCRTRNQIDHVLISKLFAGSLEDVQTRRGADMDSDHQLLVGTFRLRPVAAKQTKQTVKYEVSKLQDPTTVVMYNNSLALTLRMKTEKKLQKHASRPRRIYLELKTIEEEKAKTQNYESQEKLATRAEYRRVSLTVKLLAQNDKNLYYNNIADEIEQAANTGNMRKVYASTKKIGGNNIRNTAIIKDSDGNILTSPMSQLSRWREYYIEQQRTLDSSTWQHQNEILDISIEPPTTAEIETALLQLKNGKSAGPDDIPAELLKYGWSSLKSFKFTNEITN
ncbi:uncharacterized protein LOC142225056 [Haematobia irritans]|uniref:uncharacterized protein LOC142225056 n=1 Tax=Haematobia irritans TaxID=7368 RepID=UPI003F5019FE